MSRCFPYPPPGYSRNGATHEALIESIKLQKEKDKAKAERKKEKRERKEKKKEKKERRKDEDKVKAQKKSTETQPDKHKVLHNTKSEVRTEQLEKSDVTQEHGQPITSQKPSYSSDSTQNSNKRKREADAVPSGKPIKIRLLKKHQAPDLTTPATTDNRVADTTMVDAWKISTEPLAPSASNSLHGFCSVASNHKRTTMENHSTHQKATPTRPIKSNNVLHSLNASRNQPASTSGRPILPSSSNRTVLPEPSAVPIQKLSTQSFNSSKTVLSGSKKIEVQGVPCATPSELKNVLAKPPSHVGPTRTEKKRQKKHDKYEKLIGGWVPPVFQAHLTDVNDKEDWLARSGDKRCNVLRSGEVDGGRCREVAASALFLAEADLYALPYTVPF